MALTMKDVAKRAGVSAATISRVLNNTHYIAEDTRKRVLDAVQELGYFRNVNARRLATGRSDLLGLVISEISNPFFPELIRGFQAAAWDSGMDVLLLNTESSSERAKLIIKKLVESDVRGVAIMTSSIDCGETAELTEAGIGVVFCNSCKAGRLVSNILVDYGRGISQAIKHVAGLGHRRVAVIGGPEENRTASNIRRVLVAELRKQGLTPTSVANCNYRIDAGASAVRDVLSAAEIPTAVFCGSDLIAMGAMNALQEAGIRVPEDVSIVGIDNLPFTFLTRPPLTTVGVPREELGLRAFRALDRMFQLKRGKGTEYTLETELVIRKSTGPVRTKGLRTDRRQP
jgi:DNA-binding LacI/PurR family transcriptional regulator